MNKLTHEKRRRPLPSGWLLCPSYCADTGVAKKTIQRITRELGECCLNLQDRLLRNLPCRRLQCDETWCFCYVKEKNLPDEMRGKPGVGSMWTWTAIVLTRS